MARSKLVGLKDSRGLSWIASAHDPNVAESWLRGVDVSHHQTPGKVPLDDVDVLCVRAAYGTRRDTTFASHVNAAVQADVPLIHAYLFYRQTQDREAQLAEFLAACDGLPLNAAPVLDVESNTRYDGSPDWRRFADDCAWIAGRLAGKSGTCVLYGNPGELERAGADVWGKDYPLWLAHYTEPGRPKLPPRWSPEPSGGPFDNWIAHQWQGAPLDRSVIRCMPLVHGWKPDETWSQRHGA